MSGTIYLLHFDKPYHHARHYLGWSKSEDPTDRVNDHLAGNTKVALMRAVVAAGIHVEVARTWPGDRNLERALKERNNARSLCPVCRDAYLAECRERMRRLRAARKVPA